MIKTVSIPRGAYNTAVGIETEDNWPSPGTTLADSVNRLYCFQSADSPNLFWLDFSRLDFPEGAPVKAVPGNDISMNGDVSAKLTVMKQGLITSAHSSSSMAPRGTRRICFLPSLISNSSPGCRPSWAV